MTLIRNPWTLTFISAAVAAVTACGGGGGMSTTPLASATISTTVMDGLIQNAVVCLDTNGNGLCDTAEVQGRTDANGQVTLTIPADQVGTAKLVAMIGTDAIDADTGPVTTPYTLTTPVGRHGVISPLTTMVQAKIDADKAAGKTTSADAAATFVQTALTLKVSVFDNFIAKRNSNADYKKAGDIAHGLAVAAQESNCGWSHSATSTTGASSSEKESETEAAHQNEAHIHSGLLDKLGTVQSVDFSHSACASGMGKSCDDYIKTQVAPVSLATCTAPPTTSTVPTTPTTPTPATPATPAGSAATGKTLYAANCVMCHGANPALNANKIMKGANSPSNILGAISSNAGGMGMLKTTILAQQAADIAAYLANPGI